MSRSHKIIVFFTIVLTFLGTIMGLPYLHQKQMFVPGKASPIVQVAAVVPDKKYENGVLEEGLLRTTIMGSGFIVREDGLIVTNKHLIPSPESKLIVIMSDGKHRDATLISEHPTEDIAILKIDTVTEKLPIAIPRDSKALRPGDTVTAVGYENRSEGKILSKDREIKVISEGSALMKRATLRRVSSRLSIQRPQERSAFKRCSW